MLVNFKINGQPFTALNGGLLFKFNESVSFQIFCDTQEEIDFYWNKLTEEGEEGHCGWLKDKYGLSWQIVPSILAEIMSNSERAEIITRALFANEKIGY